MRQLAAGRREALGELYGRYARLIFSLAARSLDRAAAEEVVQDVFHYKDTIGGMNGRPARLPALYESDPEQE